MTTISFNFEDKMSWINWKETREADKIEYYNDDGQKHGIAEIFVKVRLPHKFYEIANALSIIYNSKSFDDYVSALVYEDIERLLMGPEIIGDSIIHKMTGEKTEWHTKEEKSDSTTKDTATDINTFPDIGLPSREEVESKWGKIPEDD